jgi:hypothetical protein
MQHEIIKPGLLLKPDGTLIEEGYARRFLLEYNRENIAHGWARIKEWDYYAILTPDYGVALTISEMGIMTLCNVVWLDFRAKTFESDEVTYLLTKGKTNMPRTSETGDITIHDEKIQIQNLRKPEKRQLIWNFPGFKGGAGFSCNLTLTQPAAMESMVIATSWKEKRTAFYYNQKVNCMPASGTVTIGKIEYKFDPDNQAYGVLDWGRGVWTYKNRWYWGSLSGLSNGHVIGWNIGYGFSDRSPASENMVFYDGKAHKLEEVTFHIPKKNGKPDYLQPWKFTSSDGRFEMDFEPLLDRNADVNLLIFRSIQHQVFGLFTGTFILDDGTKIPVQRMLGFAEDVYNRW